MIFDIFFLHSEPKIYPTQPFKFPHNLSNSNSQVDQSTSIQSISSCFPDQLKQALPTGNYYQGNINITNRTRFCVTDDVNMLELINFKSIPYTLIFSRIKKIIKSQRERENEEQVTQKRTKLTSHTLHHVRCEISEA